MLTEDGSNKNNQKFGVSNKDTLILDCSAPFHLTTMGATAEPHLPYSSAVSISAAVVALLSSDTKESADMPRQSRSLWQVICHCCKYNH